LYVVFKIFVNYLNKKYKLRRKNHETLETKAHRTGAYDVNGTYNGTSTSGIIGTTRIVPDGVSLRKHSQRKRSDSDWRCGTHFDDIGKDADISDS